MGRRDRRRAPRHAPPNTVVQVGWWEASEFRERSGRLCDISGAGAAVALDESPPLHDSIWLSVEGDPPSEWVRAHVTGVTPAKDGERRIGMAFAEFCPQSVFSVAIWSDETTPRSTKSTGTASARRSRVPPPKASTARGAAFKSTVTLSPSPASSKRAAPSDRASDSVPVSSASVRGALVSLSQATERKRGAPRRSASMRAWLFPLLVNLSLAVLIVCLAFMTLADARMLDALIQSLPRH